MNKIIITLLLLSVVFLSHAEKNALTYKEFGHLAMLQNPVVSPDGEKIAAIFNTPEGPSVVVSDFASVELSTIVQLKKSRDRIESISWVNPSRLLVIASYSEKSSGERFRMNRVFSVNIDGTELVELKKKTLRDMAPWEIMMAGNIRVVSLLKEDDKHILLQSYDFRDEAQAVYKVNVFDNTFRKLFVNRFNVHSWVTNEKDEVVFGYGTMENREERDIRTIWHRKNVNAEWKLLHKRKAFVGETFDPILVFGNELYVISDRETGRKALWKYDIEKGEYTELLYGHDKYDIRGVIYNKNKSEVVGVEYFEHFLKDHYFDDEDSSISALVKKSFKQYQTIIYSRSKDKNKMLILASKDNSPDKFFWLDIKNKKGGLWFSQYPYLEGKALPNVLPINFKANDGKKLSGYLTLPHAKNNKKPPLIVWPHGGPIGVRDYQYFDPFVQFFASQGYAILQVNYRGSGGFGSNFQASGHHQWGKRMQQDVYDGIDWLKEQDLVDSDNACFAGWSYGGYAALTASFQRPNQFKCFVSIAGISDLYGMADREYNWGGGTRAHVVNTIGDPTQSEVAVELKKLSAINNLEKIKAPILLLHGRYDTRVRVNQSADFYSAAQDENLDVEYIEFKFGTHHLDQVDNRLEAYEKIGEFLKEHLD
ncbi:MAG: dipeptidyl aminopeptidase/acylaminoacyl peptidase [Colwellia sp.]|jgi:dipeptidyl aminopeptidase/acylaminoacyl peptidase